MRAATVALYLALAVPAFAQTKQDYPGVTNFTRVDATVACGGATEVATLDLLKKDGFKSVINLRMASEPGVNLEQNQAKAKELLAETGLTQVRLLASDHGFFANVRPMIKESLEAAGLTVAYEEKKSSDVYATIDGNPGAFDIVVAPGDPSVFGDDADLLLRWWYAGETWTDARMHWKGQESHTKVQELLDTASQSTGDEQLAAWHETFDVISENVPLYPIFHRKTPTAFDPETLADFKPLAVTGLSFVGVGSTK